MSHWLLLYKLKRVFSKWSTTFCWYEDLFLPQWRSQNALKTHLVASPWHAKGSKSVSDKRCRTVCENKLQISVHVSCQKNLVIVSSCHTNLWVYDWREITDNKKCRSVLIAVKSNLPTSIALACYILCWSRDLMNCTIEAVIQTPLNPLRTLS